MISASSLGALFSHGLITLASPCSPNTQTQALDDPEHEACCMEPESRDEVINLIPPSRIVLGMSILVANDRFLKLKMKSDSIKVKPTQERKRQ